MPAQQRGQKSPSPGPQEHGSTSLGRLARAIVLILLGMAVTAGSAASDAYLHRGAADDGSVIYRQPTGNALATNVELRGLSENALKSEAGILRDAGYLFVRQPVFWSDIEKAPGELDWSVYDPIFAALQDVGIRPVLTLQGTPFWARAPAQVASLDAPPLNTEWFKSFCSALRSHYPDLTYFQIGANLDDPAYWGGKNIAAYAYGRILEAASVGLQVGATDSVLVSGEVGNSPESRKSGKDLATIRRLLEDPDVRALVHVVAVTVDGGNQSPYDRTANVGTDNLSRAVLVREAIDDTGATDMPVWFTHLGWSGSGQAISPQRQGDFVSAAARRVRNEWPWVGLFFNWAYGNGEPMPAGANMALVVNGQRTPLMDAMSEFGRSVLGTSITAGFAPPDSRACTYSGTWQTQHLVNGLYRLAKDSTSTVTCRFWGTGFTAFFRFSPDAGTVRYVVDQSSLPPVGTGANVRNVFLQIQVESAYDAPFQLVSGLADGAHTITIGLADANEVVIGGFLAERERPMIWPIAVLLAAGLVAMFLALRQIAYLAAETVGLIDTRPVSPSQLSLPVLANWRPAPRFRR